MPKRAAADDDASRKKSAASAEQAHHIEGVMRAKDANIAAGQRGSVVCTKIPGLFGVPVRIEGYQTVLPNYRHANSRNGRGFARLSPKSLGPVAHGQPGLPPATCIENIWQSLREYAFELDAHGDLTDEAVATRRAMYTDPVPHRRMYDAATLRKKAGLRARDPLPRPLRARYIRADGSPAFLSYVESRFLYCHWMETLAKREGEWMQLQALVDSGCNVNISGYDGYTSDASFDEQYADETRPFGHEKVLEAMLSIDDPADYPWNRYARAHPALYEGLVLLV